MKFYDIQIGHRAYNNTIIWTDFAEDEFCSADNAEEAIQITAEILNQTNNEEMEIRVREVTRDEYGGIIYGGWVYND